MFSAQRSEDRKPIVCTLSLSLCFILFIFTIIQHDQNNYNKIHSTLFRFYDAFDLDFRILDAIQLADLVLLQLGQENKLLLSMFSQDT